ncbi:hypothetical protein DXT99_05120 [Pontibacter diazotrophicus]|uniref:Uncharacterized protein n=1 Tax=Pontibacter diazotrophicus TaxID=1400979 RepID=A0A3D8LGP6_9BACT|nr:hypothetical protein DXT99_05120 [Pontibacter diazotrophicus]
MKEKCSGIIYSEQVNEPCLKDNGSNTRIKLKLKVKSTSIISCLIFTQRLGWRHALKIYDYLNKLKKLININTPKTIRI